MQYYGKVIASMTTAASPRAYESFKLCLNKNVLIQQGGDGKQGTKD